MCPFLHVKCCDVYSLSPCPQGTLKSLFISQLQYEAPLSKIFFPQGRVLGPAVSYLYRSPHPPSLGHLNRVTVKTGCATAEKLMTCAPNPGSPSFRDCVLTRHPPVPNSPPRSPAYPAAPRPSSPNYLPLPGFPGLRRSRHGDCQRRCPAPPPTAAVGGRPHRPAPRLRPRCPPF